MGSSINIKYFSNHNDDNDDSDDSGICKMCGADCDISNTNDKFEIICQSCQSSIDNASINDDKEFHSNDFLHAGESDELYTQHKDIISTSISTSRFSFNSYLSNQSNKPIDPNPPISIFNKPMKVKKPNPDTQCGHPVALFFDLITRRDGDRCIELRKINEDIENAYLTGARSTVYSVAYSGGSFNSRALAFRRAFMFAIANDMYVATHIGPEENNKMPRAMWQ